MKKQEKSADIAVPPRPGPDITAFMIRIEQKLSFIEKKMDALIGQAPGRSSQASGSTASVPLQRHHDARHGQGQASSRAFEAKPHFVPVVSPQAQQPFSNEMPQDPGLSRGNPHRRRERVLHKAVCADCQKNCEIPFKPTGERPVFCKECFSKRKSSRPIKAPPAQSQEVGPSVNIPEMPAPIVSERKVTVTKKGVGKVTVTDIAPPSARETSSRGRAQRPAPARKPKR